MAFLTFMLMKVLGKPLKDFYVKLPCPCFLGVKIGHVSMDQTFVKWNNR